MKILLINPPFLPKFSRSSRSPAVTKSSTIYYPIWLSHAAGLLEKNGHEIMLIDFPAEQKELKDYKKKIIDYAPKMIVCDTSTPSIESDIEVLQTLKKWFNLGVTGVLVGTHPSALPEEVLKSNRAVDIVARGEYDWTLCDLAENPEIPSEISGISYRVNGYVVNNPDREYAENLDEIPFVSRVFRKHLNIRNYFYAHCQNPVISIFAGRGCPNQCYYCLYPQVMFGRRYRHRSTGHLVDEFEYIQKELPYVREILLDDDNFTADPKYVENVCNELISRRINIPWSCEARVNLNYNLMIKMKKAGCRLLVAGFESGDQKVLDAIHKGTTLSQGVEFAQNAKKAGLRVHGCFMIGNRKDDPETLEKTLNYALKLPIDTAQFFPLMVYPGTEAYQWARARKYINAKNFRQWLTKEGMHNCVLSTDRLSNTDLVDFCDLARRKFYLRPSYLFYKSLDLIRNPNESYRTIKSAKTLLTHLFRRHR